MHEWDCGGERCENPVVSGSEFCIEHIGVKLCKASGIQYQSEGNSSGWFRWINTIYHHPVDTFAYRTKRAEFCCDRCRNLWRDTRKTRERAEAVTRLKDGKSDPHYSIATLGDGSKVLLDKQTSRYQWNVSLL